MSKYSEKIFIKSFGYAIHGIKLVLKSQPNIIRQVFAAVIAVFLGIFLKFCLLDFCILFVLIATVIVAEMLNSAIEFTIDAVFKNKFSKLAGMAKDIAAGAVCIASFSALITGSLLFVHRAIPLLKGVIL